ncbi:hypothetical protein ACQ4N7_29250 [Nodosilinea sp. AN01ver1]|uniref:hypothetical protein n=1 Tax=Nodosilinea sp. AN01ver1 TaxID=3423362 RepID=UPI003D3211FF
MNTTPKTTTARHWTLSDIAESQNVLKRTAQSWLAKAKREHGEDFGEVIGGARRFSVEERDILISYAAPPRPVKVEAEQAAEPRIVQTEAFPEFADRPAEPRPVEIVVGNHRATVEAPTIGGQIDLARFRGDIETRTYQDPLGGAHAAIALFDALGNAMDADLDQSFAQLETTAATVQQLEAKARQMEAKSLEYQVTQKILARLQNQQTAKLGELLGKAQELGGGGGQ